MTTHQMLDERYGRTRSRAPRWLVVSGVVVAAAVIVGAGWMTVAGALDDVDARTTGFQLVDDGSVRIDFQVTAPPGRSVACALEAQDADHGVVGWKVITLDETDGTARAFQESIPTVAEATTGLVNSCWVT
ncbi:DUF4307 domain-containing protein [Microbacterium invictum]|uniref:DUF4307 domain-containing protein n=1 Tax=Microbacterium invictum TaxID=515415 RepID=A0ABZ0VDN6_9MICO|nr:DUF4307 domain-containing protein [Microbacterium invictum]WQB71741.1 DUF4307 domain-containing protein [Microbacterium invictum]